MLGACISGIDSDFDTNQKKETRISNTPSSFLSDEIVLELGEIFYVRLPSNYFDYINPDDPTSMKNMKWVWVNTLDVSVLSLEEKYFESDFPFIPDKYPSFPVGAEVDIMYDSFGFPNPPHILMDNPTIVYRFKAVKKGSCKLQFEYRTNSPLPNTDSSLPFISEEFSVKVI